MKDLVTVAIDGTLHKEVLAHKEKTGVPVRIFTEICLREGLHRYKIAKAAAESAARDGRMPRRICNLK